MPTMTFLPPSRRALALVALLGAAACGSDSIVDPTFGSACNVGSIAAGQTITSSITPSSCQVTYHFYSGGRTPYEAYTVKLQQGKGYMFTMIQVADPAQDSLNEVDPLLTLWGKNADGVSVPLAMSDDDARGIDGHDSQIYFIAPETGTYQLVAASYWEDEFGGYRLEARECPIVGTVDTAGTYDFALVESPCVRIAPGGAGADTTRFVFVSLHEDPWHSVGFTATSGDFTPTWEAFGPGLDTYANIYNETVWDHRSGSGVPGTLNLDGVGGQLTFAIGGTSAETTGSFSLTVTRSAITVPPALAAWHGGQPTMKSSFPRKSR